ncbi:hypothetical protein [Streptomyces sp. NPDC056549]|uniref:hypothetical protein n=1 Tax=Streptomyces sp. NPDC056549 TaxID=3345864 RepID=UPI0036A263AC
MTEPYAAGAARATLTAARARARRQPDKKTARLHKVINALYAEHVVSATDAWAHPFTARTDAPSCRTCGEPRTHKHHLDAEGEMLEVGR